MLTHLVRRSLQARFEALIDRFSSGRLSGRFGAKQSPEVHTSVGNHDVESPGFRFDVGDGRSVPCLVAGDKLDDVHFARVLRDERMKVSRRRRLSRACKDDDALSLC